MIELRWLEREEPVPHKDYPNVMHTVRVLQSRTQVMQIGSGYRQVGAGDGNTYVSEYQRPMGFTWTAWQDVPIVKQGD